MRMSYAYVKNVEGLQLNANGLYAPGVYNFDGVPPVNGAGVRLMWVPSWWRCGLGKSMAPNGTVSTSATIHPYWVGKQFYSVCRGYGTITGGASNTVSGTAGFIGAGESNQASGEHAGIIGGLFNVASGSTSFIGTGQYNTASGVSSVVVGGEENIAAGKISTAAGYGNKAASYGEVALGLFATDYTPASTTTFNANDCF
ncbi:MAG: hypothetical protein IPL49_17965 [Saprospirales bacterium]|nr:hypothetical protein [Saprospirales bacterium]